MFYCFQNQWNCGIHLRASCVRLQLFKYVHVKGQLLTCHIKWKVLKSYDLSCLFYGHEALVIKMYGKINKSNLWNQVHMKVQTVMVFLNDSCSKSFLCKIKIIILNESKLDRCVEAWQGRCVEMWNIYHQQVRLMVNSCRVCMNLLRLIGVW